MERAEWLNRILQQLWPKVGDYVKTLLSEKVSWLALYLRESAPRFPCLHCITTIAQWFLAYLFPDSCKMP